MSQDSFNPFEFLTTPWGKLPLGPGASGTAGFGGTDLNELDKRINELKAVEQWLSLNLNLLKTTIQGLEVQRGTLAAIQSFTESMTSPAAPKASKPHDTPNSTQFSAVPPGQAVDQAAAWWESMQQQFGQMMQATQASAQSMVNQTTKPGKKSAAKAGKTGQAEDKN
jgi:hypothetical protein